MIEIYKDVKGYDGLYKVSNKGNIMNRHGRILKNRLHKDGYLSIALCKNGKCKYYQIHRLVAIAFIPNPFGLEMVNHKDENKSNNYVSNLEWCTRSYNVLYGTGISKRLSKTMKRIKAINVESNEEIMFENTKECAMCGFIARTVRKACRGQLRSGNKYKGYKWEYIGN